MQVEGLKFNGVQFGDGIFPDSHVFTDLTTSSTFYVINPTPDSVAARRDQHLAEWAKEVSKQKEMA